MVNGTVCGIFRLANGRLERFGIQQVTAAASWDFGPAEPEETSDVHKCLTDGNNFLWVPIDRPASAPLRQILPQSRIDKVLKTNTNPRTIDWPSLYPPFNYFPTFTNWNASQSFSSYESDFMPFCSVPLNAAGESMTSNLMLPAVSGLSTPA